MHIHDLPAISGETYCCRSVRSVPSIRRSGGEFPRCVGDEQFPSSPSFVQKNSERCSQAEKRLLLCLPVSCLRRECEACMKCGSGGIGERSHVETRPSQQKFFTRLDSNRPTHAKESPSSDGQFASNVVVPCWAIGLAASRGMQYEDVESRTAFTRKTQSRCLHFTSECSPSRNAGYRRRSVRSNEAIASTVMVRSKIDSHRSIDPSAVISVRMD